MKYLIILSILGIAWCSNYHLRSRRSTTCTKSYDCTSTTPCCRDANNHTLTGQQDHFAPVLGGSTSSGTCSSILGKKGDVCDSSCGCESGYTCYRPMSGVCCPPMRCYDTAWVKQQQHYWANCHPPTCFYPP
ncbi:Hypothetical predicted protein [Mytilus galloprovincialis]|uniref:Uncharacterized protein n=1 Tax=Mytilus galloprovincialis TaxID=29158 RepID=A0A8B6FHK1_MYTGA|nr:Hypothetical predicted protein [Mytilus galloprovincialis]